MKPSLAKTLRRDGPKTGAKVPVVAGDQCCGGLFGNLKKLQQRLSIRHGTSTKSAINTLSCAWLLRGCGLQHVLKALKMYKESVQDRVKPDKAFHGSFWESS